MTSVSQVFLLKQDHSHLCSDLTRYQNLIKGLKCHVSVIFLGCFKCKHSHFNTTVLYISSDTNDPLFCSSLRSGADWCLGTVQLMNSPHTAGLLKPVRRVRGIQAHRWESNTSQAQTSGVNKSFKPGHILPQRSMSFSYQVHHLKVSRTNCGVIVFAWKRIPPQRSAVHQTAV